MSTSVSGFINEAPEKIIARNTTTLMPIRPMVTCDFACASLRRGTEVEFVYCLVAYCAICARQGSQTLRNEYKGSSRPHLVQSGMCRLNLEVQESTIEYASISRSFYHGHGWRQLFDFRFGCGHQDYRQNNDRAPGENVGIYFFMKNQPSKKYRDHRIHIGIG